MKRFFMGAVLVLMLAFTSVTVSAQSAQSSAGGGGGGGSSISIASMTIAQLQALLQQLIAQLNALIAAQQGSTSVIPTTIVNDTVFSSNYDAFIKLSIKGYETNKKVDHWVLGYNCFEGVTLDSGKSPLLCDGKSTGKNSLTFYKYNIYDVTRDYLMITAGALNKSSSGVNLQFTLEARDSGDKTIGRDDKTITLNSNGTTQPQAAANQITKANLNLSYDSSKNEVALNADQQFTVMSGADDVYVIWANMKIDRVGGESVQPKSGWIPNGASSAFSGLSNTVQKTFVDNNGYNQTGWLVKAGQKATFVTKMSMNPQLMYSGVYRSELNYVGIYSNSVYGGAVMKGDSMPSNNVTIVGERNVVIPPSAPSVTITSPNGGESFVLGQPIKIPYVGKKISNTHAFLVPADSPGNGIGSLGVIGDGANPSGTFEWGGKWLLTSSVGGSIIDVQPGKYKIYMVGDVAGESGKTVSDMSDSYFTISSPVTPPSEETDLKTCSLDTNYTFNQNLTIGSSGNEVFYLKCFLNAKGYLLGNYVNDYFGVKTKEALAKYQVAKGITPVDGYFGPISRAVVNADMGREKKVTPSITVVSPNGGEVFKPGDTVSGSFTTNLPNGKYFDVSLVNTTTHYDGMLYQANTAPADRQTFSFVIPSNIQSDNNYKVRVVVTDGNITQDMSDNTFTITSPVTSPTKPSISILSPGVREVWKIGETYRIAWKADNVDTVDLVVYSDPSVPGAGNTSSIASGIPASRGYFDWTIPQSIPQGKTFKIRITDPNRPYGEVAQDSERIEIGSYQPQPEIPKIIIPKIVTPSVSSISPASGPAGTNVTITGAGFASTGNTIRLNGVADWVKNVSSSNGSSISFTIPKYYPNYSSASLSLPPSLLKAGDTLNLSVKNANGESATKEFKVQGTVSQNEQLSSLANVLEALKQMLSRSF